MGMLHKEHFEQMAKNCELNPRLILKELRNMAEILPQSAQTLSNELNEIHASRVYGSIVWEIGRLCRQAME